MSDGIKKNLLVSFEIVLILLSLAFLFWRAPVGYCFNDEPLVVTFAQRLSFGDQLITDEWNGAQNVGPLILPFYFIFHIFSKSNDGILLTFRYIYCILWFLCCLIVFSILRKKYKSAIFSFVYLILFAPLDYMTLSYTSIGLMASLLIGTLFFYEFEIKPMKSFQFGFLLAILSSILVLCCPYMAIAYVVYLLVILIKNRKVHNEFQKANIYSLFIIIGFALIYVFFFILYGNSISKILSNLPLLFSAADHPTQNPLYAFFNCVLKIFGMSRLFTLSFILSIIYSFLSSKYAISNFYTVPIVLLSLVAFVKFQYNACTAEYIQSVVNYQIAGMAFLGAIAFFLSKKKNYKLFFSFYISGLLYTYFFYLSSNTGSIAICMPLAVCGAAGIIMICMLGDELVHSLNRDYLKKTIHFTVALILIIQISSEIYIRFERFNWDAPVGQLTEKIEVGAAKGIKTSAINKYKYEKTYIALNNLLDEASRLNLIDENEKFISLEFAPIIYLDADLPFGTFSSWTFELENNPERLLKYYQLNPENLPEIIFTDAENDNLNLFFDRENFSCLEFDNYCLYITK